MNTEQQHLLEGELIADEGLRLKPYVDSVGKLTIGIGRNLTDRGITATEAMFLFRNDIALTEQELAAFTWFQRLTPERQRAIFNMAFNLGAPKLHEFKRMIAAIEARQYEAAAAEMLASKWAGQVGGRARRLADLMIHDPAV